MTVDVLTREERVARARLALAHAERRTGARSVRLSEDTGRSRAPHPPEQRTPAERAGAPGDASVPGRADGVVLAPVVEAPAAQPSPQPTPVPTVVLPASATASSGPAPAVFPAVSSAASSAVSSDTAPAVSLLTTERPPLPVPPQLEVLLPDGLRRGATTAVVGSTSLTLALLAAVSAAGAWAAVVGQPSLGLLAAAEAGVALERLAVVPRPGADAAVVLGALLDGMDVVLVGPEVRLTDADRRRLSARARERGSVLLASVPWPGAGVVLGVEPAREHGGWTGLGDGEGRLRAQRVRVVRAGRSGAGVPMSVELSLPLTATALPAEPPTGLPVSSDTARHHERRARRDDHADLRLVG